MIATEEYTSRQPKLLLQSADQAELKQTKFATDLNFASRIISDMV